MKTIAIDFDGVIHAYRRGWHDGSIYDNPIDGAFDAIRKFQKQGMAVFIHTTRSPETVADWLGERAPDFDIVYNIDPFPVFWDRTDQILVTDRKLPAAAYIDDRAVRFIGYWPETLQYMRDLEEQGKL